MKAQSGNGERRQTGSRGRVRASESRIDPSKTHRGDPTFPGRGANVRDAADGHRARHDGVRLRADAASVFAIRPRWRPRRAGSGRPRGDRGRRGSENSRIPPRAARERSFIYEGMYEYMLMLRVSTTVAQGPGAGMCSVMHRRETTEMAARVDAQLRRTQREWDAHLTRVLSCRWSSPPTARSSTSPCPQRGTPLQLSRLISSLPPQRLCCAAAALARRFTLRRSLHVYLKYMKPSSSFCTETVVLRQIQRSRM